VSFADFKSVDGHLKCPWWVRHPFAPANQHATHKPQSLPSARLPRKPRCGHTVAIKDLGRWESLEMVQRYTRSVTFEDSLRFYKAPSPYDVRTTVGVSGSSFCPYVDTHGQARGTS